VSKRNSVTAAVIVATLVLSLSAQDKKKEWKDRAEYDLYESITKTSDPNLWLTSLDKWRSQYTQSDYADVRRVMYLETFRSLDRPREAFNAAQEVLKDNPNNLVALSAIVGYVYRLNPPAPADLETAEKAAAQILANLDAIYAKDNRPNQMSDADAAKAKPDLRVFAQRTIGWIYYARKDWDKAEDELTKVLDLDPKQAQVSYWLGVAILGEAKMEKQALALYDFARAAAYDGPGSMPATDRQQVQTYLNTVYKKYHGSDEGLTTLLAAAKASHKPPADFKILSQADILKQRQDAEEAAAKANPMLALWKSIKTELTGEGGVAYFENNMKDAALPGGVNGVTRFKGRLVSMTPAVRPKELVLAIQNPSVADTTLKLDSALPGKMEPGEEIEFDGVAKSYTKEPFMVTFEVEKAKVVGWAGKNELTKKSTVTKKK
jgi:tetratricopeptide (TPR) repeat protein